MKKKLILIALLVVAAAAAVTVGLGMRNNGPEGLEVEAEPVERITLVETVTATGKIQPVTQVNISADVSGKITRLEIEEGDWVEKGQLLLELEREQYVASMENSEASLRVAQSNVEVAHENLIRAEKDYVRLQQLFQEELETQAELDGVYAEFQAAKARHQSAIDQVGQQRAAVKQSQDALSKTAIYAPMSGTVSTLNKEVGEIAVGSQFQSDVILILSNLSGMEALVDVDENDIVRVAIGDSATIEVDALPGLTLAGEVTEIANSAKVSGSGTANEKTEFEVKIAVTDRNNSLRPGMTASADVVTETRTSAVGIPIQCVAVRTPEQLTDAGDDQGPTDWTPDKDGFVEIVFVVEDGQAFAKQVRTGIQSDTHIEIVEGLEEAEQVVVGNYRAISRDLQHGSVVIVQNKDAEGSIRASR
jgi:HlyD family secretion protein